MTCPANPDIIQVPWEFVEGDEAAKVQKFGSDDGEMATFRIKTEDHTLGNALRWMLSSANRKTVDIAAYTIPHPHSDAMNIRIQTKNHANATDVLIDSCKQVQQLCDNIDAVYSKALQKYESASSKSSHKKKKSKTKHKKSKVKQEQKQNDVVDVEDMEEDSSD